MNDHIKDKKIVWEKALTLAAAIATVVATVAAIIIGYQQNNIIKMQTKLMQSQTEAAQFEQRQKIRDDIKKLIIITRKIVELKDLFSSFSPADPKCQNACRDTKVVDILMQFRNQKYLQTTWNSAFENYDKYSHPLRAGSELYALHAGFRVDLLEIVEKQNPAILEISEILSDAALNCDLEQDKTYQVIYYLGELAPWLSRIPRTMPDDLEILMENTIKDYAHSILENGDQRLNKPFYLLTIEDLHNSIIERTSALSRLMNDVSLACQEKSQRNTIILKNVNKK